MRAGGWEGSGRLGVTAGRSFFVVRLLETVFLFFSSPRPCSPPLLHLLPFPPPLSAPPSSALTSPSLLLLLLLFFFLAPRH
ncbi:hypothetical protein BDQ17DRAFT_476926 [Cyathus striatus]|nr:hypothetical protein BDQ17DRAFT_476926 [Cyathus striatus]